MSKAALAGTAAGGTGGWFPAFKPGTAQNISISAASTQGSAFGANTTLICVTTDSLCYIAIGTNPVASTNTSMKMLPSSSMCFAVDPFDLIAVIGAGGTINVCEGQ